MNIVRSSGIRGEYIIVNLTNICSVFRFLSTKQWMSEILFLNIAKFFSCVKFIFLVE